MNDSKSSKKPLLIGGAVVLGVVTLCCCSASIGMYFMGQQNLEAQEANFPGLDAACRGEAVAGAAPVVADGTIRVRLYDTDGDMIHHWLPQEMWSTQLADSEAVVCRVGGNEAYEIERCEYETGFVTGLAGGRNVIVRQGYRQTYRVVAAQTGQTLAEANLEGDPPDACPANADFDRGGETDSLTGDIIDGDDIGEWLRTLPL